LGNADIEEGSAKFGRTTWSGKRRIGGSVRIFQE